MKKFENLLIEDSATLYDYLQKFNFDLPIMGDTESTGLDMLSATMLGISLYQFDYVLPAFIVAKTPFFQGRGIPLHELNEIFKPFISKAKIVFHNAKYDTGVFEHNGFKIPNVYADTTGLIHCVNPELEKNLEIRIHKDFGYAKKTFKEWIDPEKAKTIKWVKGGAWPANWNPDIYKVVPLETLGTYASEDVYWLHFMHQKYSDKAIEMDTKKIHDNIELPLVHTLRRMWNNGVKINPAVLRKLETPVLKGLSEIQHKVHSETGFVFNLNSGKQKAEIFYKKLGYKIPAKTKSGAPSTDRKALEHLAYSQGCKAAELMLDHSKLSKLYSGYIKAIPGLLDADGRLRANFNATGTTTGRYSSSSPNLQNQPNNSDYPVRSSFVADVGNRLLCLDYSQIELRIAAHLSKDVRMMQAFIDNRDIHQEVADGIGIQRKEAKSVNFGILYGLAASSLAVLIKKREREAQKMLDDYGDTYEGVIQWKRKVEKSVAKKGYVKNMFGRIRLLPHAQNPNIKGFYYGALRQAVNTKIQGAAADMMKLAMIKIDEWIVESSAPVKMELTVHDELLFESKTSYAPKAFNKIKHIMETIVPMRVPIIAEGKICDHWAQMKDDNYIGYPTDFIDTENNLLDPYLIPFLL